MDCPVGTVMSRLYRARRLLQRALHDYAVEQGIIKATDSTSAISLDDFRKRRHGSGGES